MSIKIEDWSGCAAPQLPFAEGHFVHVAPFDNEVYTDGLFSAISGEDNKDLWQFIPFPQPQTSEQLAGILAFTRQPPQNWHTHVLIDAVTKKPVGMASYMRVRPEHGSAEVGCIIYSKTLQRTPAATEAMYLMAKHLFDDLGYRRYEWKCNNDNMASRRAAVRLGFVFEGVFRNDMVVHGKNRDTAWYSMTDTEWPVLKAAFETWLAPENFDADQRQIKPLEAFRQ